jgi:hypothetical protein
MPVFLHFGHSRLSVDWSRPVIKRMCAESGPVQASDSSRSAFGSDWTSRRRPVLRRSGCLQIMQGLPTSKTPLDGRRGLRAGLLGVRLTLPPDARDCIMSTFYRPPCPKCKTMTMLARVTPGPSGFHIRTFECPTCNDIHQLVGALVDPMTSLAMAGWLGGELRAPA